MDVKSKKKKKPLIVKCKVKLGEDIWNTYIQQSTYLQNM